MGISLPFAEFPEGHGRRRGHVQRVHSVGHGDAHHVVGSVNGLARQPVAFRAHHEGQPGLAFQCRGVERDGVVRQGQCGGAESQSAQVGELAQSTPRVST